MKSHYLVLFCLTLLLSSCDSVLSERGNGVMITETISLDDYERITISGNFRVMLKKSENSAVTLTVDENLRQYIRVENEDGLLEIRSDRNLNSREELELFIEYDEIHSLTAGGASVIESEDPIRGEHFKLSLSGAGAVDLELDLSYLDVSISGAGAVDLKGRATEQHISMSGAGGFDAENLKSERCSVSISGVGGAKVNVSEELDASVSGVGGIKYFGNPEKVSKRVSGMGKVEAAEEDESL